MHDSDTEIRPPEEIQANSIFVQYLIFCGNEKMAKNCAMYCIQKMIDSAIPDCKPYYENVKARIASK